MNFRLRDLTQTIELGMEVENAVKLCAKAINSTKGYRLKEYDVENGIITCFYEKGTIKFYVDETDACKITFMFHGNGHGGTFCTGSISYKGYEYNLIAVRMLRNSIKDIFKPLLL